MNGFENAEPSAESTEKKPPSTVGVQIDWSAPDPVSTPVTRAIAAVSNKEPPDVEPLSEQVDPDALNDLFRPRRTGPSRTAGTVSFVLEGHEVTVHATGTIVVRAPDEGVLHGHA